MEHIAAIMMLVGCAGDNADCREVPAPTIAFETVEECREMLRPAIDEVLGRYPVIYGKCAEVDPALFIEDATITWQITPGGELDIDIDFESSGPVMLAEDTTSTIVARN